MKKAIIVILALLLASLAFAQEVTQEDVQDTEIMDSVLGIELRFEQLKASIKNNIEAGEIIIGELLADDPDADTARMEEILSEMQSLIAEIDSLDMSGNETELIETYLIIKAESKDLTSEFRQLARSNAPSDKVQEIKNKIASSINTNNQATESRIQNMIRQFNAFRLKTMYNMMGKADPQMGSVNKETASSMVMNIYKGLNPADKSNAGQKIMEGSARGKINSMAIADDLEADLEKIFQARKGVRIQDQDRDSTGDGIQARNEGPSSGKETDPVGNPGSSPSGDPAGSPSGASVITAYSVRDSGSSSGSSGSTGNGNGKGGN